ncbi:hypothetical protein [Arthrobacter sp. JSM 101049]|uniref:hypothetical protein n=1 Tax=Arthrobacter sp. JSM 101049 TaxID=929097 RepID=UPI003565DBAB
MSSMRITGNSTGPFRAGHYRLAAVVYAVVVILGLAGSGAQALWNQSGTAVASVSTGTWPPQQVATVTCSSHVLLVATTAELEIDFAFPLDADAVKVTVTDGNGTVHTQSVPRGATDEGVARFVVENGLFQWNNVKVPVTVASSYKGTEGQPVDRTVTWSLLDSLSLDYDAVC